ncbi:hypothetical protein [Botrimarina hoheduenensis]|uniref:Carboxypeptidase regulatory-like domain-containing protein n=1 Tax=Botrimarina hoheduenensis TaxID=2528000 RepID=A0A5C5VST2_9BACT|nr:hypothetical protein [Botrimarina hoheduenensis]TWT40639.1 hypothetical protein Pla111_32840 [Botrimarina hoheduenensis]
MTLVNRNRRAAAGCLIVASTAMVLGCGGSGVQRLDLSGTVTYDGQPVPAGELRFEPNASKGASGPAGYATIVDGEYDTRNEDKGPVPGAVRIKVIGYVSAREFAPQLFRPYTMEADLTESSGSYDIDVPTGGK